MQKIRYGIIGCGSIAYTHASAIAGLEHAAISACYDAREESAQAFSVRFGCKPCASLEELLAGDYVDAVAICTPCSTHERIIYAAATQGKHILCEKPVDVSSSRLEEMIAYCRASGVLFAGVMQHRYDPAVEAIHRAIGEGYLGDLLCSSARIIWYRDTAYFAQSPWRIQRENGGTVLLNQGIHYLDLMLHLCGEECLSVSGSCRTLGKGAKTENFAAAQLDFANGAAGCIECTTAAYPGICSELGLYGTEGTVLLRNDELFFYDAKGKRCAELDAMIRPDALWLKNKDHLLPHAGHQRQYADFHAAILEGRSPRFDARDSLKTLQLIEGIEESSRSGRRVDMPRK